MAAAAQAVGSPEWLVAPEELVAHFDLRNRGWFDLDTFCVIMSLLFDSEVAPPRTPVCARSGPQEAWGQEEGERGGWSGKGPGGEECESLPRWEREGGREGWREGGMDGGDSKGPGGEEWECLPRSGSPFPPPSPLLPPALAPAGGGAVEGGEEVGEGEVRGAVEGGWGGGGGRGGKNAFEEMCQVEGGGEREGGCEIREMFAALDVRGQGFLTSQSLQEVFFFAAALYNVYNIHWNVRFITNI
jgi:hypothetical protein